MSNTDRAGNGPGIDRRARPVAAIATLIVLLAVVALPVLAADPSASPGASSSAAPEQSAGVAPSTQPNASAEPDDSADPDQSAEPAAPAAEPDQAGPDQAKPDTGPKEKKDKAPEQAVTLQGTVSVGTDEDDDPSYELTSGGKTYRLEAGPPWYYGDNHPLKPFVGQSVTVTGEAKEGSTEVDVLTVNGTAIREAGKPPWAGGWKQVGERHPGWSEEKAARWAEKAAKQQQKFGGCWPPGHCKEQDAAESGVAPTH
jgi:hypothetical protein